MSSDCFCCQSISRYPNDSKVRIWNWNPRSIGEADESPQEFYLGTASEPFQKRLFPLEHQATGKIVDFGRVDMDLARRWLIHCEKNHVSQCAVRAELRFGSSTYGLGPIFLDVEDKCLIREKHHQKPYAALSYVWGNSCTTKTTLVNFASLQVSQRLTAPGIVLPKSIRDAIYITLELGIRYLWCDCLCIIQDDPEIQKHINAMALTYANAHVTIAITDADNTDRGVVGLHTDSNDARDPRWDLS